MAVAKPTSQRRDKLVIMAQIIDIARPGALKTQIMYKANLSFSQLTQYLNLLQDVGFLEKKNINGKELYKPTQKGALFLKRHAELVGLMGAATIKPLY